MRRKATVMTSPKYEHHLPKTTSIRTIRLPVLVGAGPKGGAEGINVIAGNTRAGLIGRPGQIGQPGLWRLAADGDHATFHVVEHLNGEISPGREPMPNLKHGRNREIPVY